MLLIGPFIVLAGRIDRMQTQRASSLTLLTLSLDCLCDEKQRRTNGQQGEVCSWMAVSMAPSACTVEGV